MKRDVIYALSAALLFGASTPFAKLLVGNEAPVMLAGLLYLGSGIGLTLIRSIRDRGWQSPNLATPRVAMAFGRDIVWWRTWACRFTCWPHPNNRCHSLAVTQSGGGADSRDCLDGV